MASASKRRPIVLGVDARDPGTPATAWAADEADRRGLPLLLVHAVLRAPAEPRGFAKRHAQELRADGRRVLDEATALVGGRHPALEVTGTLLDGNPGQVLCRASRQAELVVLGSRRLSRAEEFLSASSVAVPVSAQADCPVVVVREPEPAAGGRPYLVVGVDGSPSSDAAAEVAFDLAARRGAALHAVWVWQPQPLARVDEPSTVLALRQRLTGATAVHADRYPEVELTHEVVRGHPVEELAGASEHALAVVVGRRGHGGFSGMRLGSLPHGLLHHAHCPVVTVPRPPDPPDA